MACGPVTPVPQSLIATTADTGESTTIAPVRSNLEPITLENIHRLELVETWGKGQAHAAQLSNDGTLVAIYTPTGVYLYDTKTDQEKLLPGTTDGYWHRYGGVAFNPNGDELAFGSEVIHFWSLSEQKITKIMWQHVHAGPITELAYSPDGGFLLARNNGSGPCEGPAENFALYEIETRKLLFEKSFCGIGFAHFQFSQDGKLYLFNTLDVVGGPMGRVLMLETATGQILQEIDYPYETSDGLFAEKISGVSPSGQTFAIKKVNFREHSADSTFTSWLVDTNSLESLDFVVEDGQIIFTQNQNRRWIVKGSYDDLGKRQGVYELQDNSGKVLCTFSQDEVPFSQNISVDGNIVLSRISEFEFLLWEVETCQPFKRLHFPDPDNKLVFTPNGEKLVTTNSWTIYVWDVATGEYQYTVPVFTLAGDGPPFAMSADSTNLLTFRDETSQEGELFHKYAQINLTTGELIKTFGQGVLWTDSMEVSPFQTLTIVDDSRFELQNITTGQRIALFEHKHFNVVYTPDKSKAAFNHSEGIMVVDLRNGAILHTINLSSTAPVRFLSNTQLLVITDADLSQDAMPVVYLIDDIYADELQMTLIGETSCYWGNLIVSKSHMVCNLEDGRLQMWDLARPGESQILLGHAQIPSGYTYLTLLFNADETMLLSLSSDYFYGSPPLSVIRFWDISTGQLRGEIRVNYKINDFQFSPDDRFLGTITSNGLIRIWGVPYQP